MGVAPLNIEIGRYTNLAVEGRLCSFCLGSTEDETHVMSNCDMYNDLRHPSVEKARILNSNFSLISNADKMSFLFSNHEMLRPCAKTCLNILQRRSFRLYKH